MLRTLINIIQINSEACSWIRADCGEAQRLKSSPASIENAVTCNRSPGFAGDIPVNVLPLAGGVYPFFNGSAFDGTS